MRLKYEIIFESCPILDIDSNNIQITKALIMQKLSMQIH